MCALWMLPVKAFKQHRQLCWREVDFAVADGRPDEASTLQTFDEQAQAIVVRPQQLHHVSAATAEDEQMAAERVLIEHALYP